MLRKIRIDDMQGFTLIETMAALVVFSIVTLGVVPLIGATMRGSALSRQMTVSKNLSVEAMERARGLPYHIKQAAQPGNVDLLDFYHPAPPNVAGTALFRTTCAAGTTAPACPRNIPAGSTVVFEARFVTTTGATVPTPSTYNARTAGADTPPSLLVELTVRTTATFRGRQRSFSLRSLLADRKFSGLKVSGLARLSYAIQVATNYRTSTVDRNLTAIAGENESRIETRRDSIAAQATRAARLRLVNALDVGTADLVTPMEGATSVVNAPPDFDPIGTSAPGALMSHPAPLVGDIAGFDGTLQGQASPSQADVQVAANTTQLPLAQGGFSYFTGTAPLDFWVDKPEADRSTKSPLHLNFTKKLLSVYTSTGTTGVSGPPITGYTTAETTSLPTGGVRTTVHVEVRNVGLFPGERFAEEGVVVIDELVADVSCGSSAGSGGTGATGSWSARLRYWTDPEGNAREQRGAYIPLVLTNGMAIDELATIKQLNPVVYEDTQGKAVGDGSGSAPEDAHLFAVQHEHVDATTGSVVVHQHPGYLADWRSQQAVATATQADGRVTSAAIANALALDTAPVPVAPSNPDFVPTPLTISLGALRCDAVDFR